jgi:hypothetical protein
MTEVTSASIRALIALISERQIASSANMAIFSDDYVVYIR